MSNSESFEARLAQLEQHVMLQERLAIVEKKLNEHLTDRAKREAVKLPVPATLAWRPTLPPACVAPTAEDIKRINIENYAAVHQAHADNCKALLKASGYTKHTTENLANPQTGVSKLWRTVCELYDALVDTQGMLFTDRARISRAIYDLKTALPDRRNGHDRRCGHWPFQSERRIRDDRRKSSTTREQTTCK